MMSGDAMSPTSPKPLLSLVEAKAVANKPSDLPTPGRKPVLESFPKLSSKAQLEMMNLVKDGKLKHADALDWAQARYEKEVVPVLTNEQQLDILNKVKLGRMSIDEALSQAAVQVCALSFSKVSVCVMLFFRRPKARPQARPACNPRCPPRSAWSLFFSHHVTNMFLVRHP